MIYKTKTSYKIYMVGAVSRSWIESGERFSWIMRSIGLIFGGILLALLGILLLMSKRTEESVLAIIFLIFFGIVLFLIGLRMRKYDIRVVSKK